MIEQFALDSLTKYNPGNKIGLYYSDSVYKELKERTNGILPDSPLSSTLINTVLRQSTFAYTILQNTIKQTVLNEREWTADEIDNALSCTPTHKKDRNYSDLRNAFINVLSKIRLITYYEDEDTSSIPKGIIPEAVYAEDYKTTPDASQQNNIATAINTINSLHTTVEDNLEELVSYTAAYINAETNRLQTDTSLVCTNVKNYSDGGNIAKEFNELITLVTNIENTLKAE